MKVKDLVVENKIDEAPMGALKTFGLQSISGVSPTASGKFQTGTMANQLSADFKEYLGKTGQTAEPDIVLAFLKSKGVPTDSAEKIIAAGPEKSMLAKGMDALKGMVKGKGSDQQQSQQGQDPAQQQPAQGKDQNPQPKGRIEPKLEPEQPQQGATPQDAAAGQQPPARKQGGGKVAGQQSQTPGAVAKREKRAASGKASSTSGAIDQFVKTQTGPNPVTMKAEPQQNPVPQKQKQPRQRKKPAGAVGDKNWQRLAQPSFGESIEYEYDLLLEALSKGQLDKIFMAAAQDAAKAGVQGAGGGQQSGAGSAAQPGAKQQGGGTQTGGGGGGALGGFARGLMGQDDSQGDGKVTGQLNANQLASLLPGVDPKILAQAVAVVRQGKQPNRTQMTTLGNAMIAIIKADPQTTTKVMQLLKRVSVQ